MKNTQRSIITGIVAAAIVLAAAFAALFHVHTQLCTHTANETGEYLYAAQRIAVVGGVLILLFIALVGLILYNGVRTSRRIQRSFDELNLFNNALPAIVFKGVIDEYMTLEYISSGVRTLTGYTEDEFKKRFSSRFLELVHPDDREKLLDRLKYGAGCGAVIQERCRLVRKDGSVLWVGADLRRIQANGVAHVVGVMLDVSERMRAEREIAISREKFRIALEHTPNAFMEFLHEGNVLLNTDPKAAFLGLPARIENTPESLIAAGYILPESIETLRCMHHKIALGEEYASCDLHVKTPSMSADAWLHVDMTNIFMPDGAPAQAIVLLRDITSEKVAERDHLTGLYNRSTGEALMRAALMESPDARHAFLMFDIDRFKLVNDTYGHYTGDAVLRAFADTLGGCFRASDVVSRLGGDEFVVFMRAIRSPELAKRRAAAVIEAARKIEVFGTVGSVGASCGIAFFPDDGADIKTLYERADNALYRAKQAGRGRFEVYGEE